MKYKILQLSFPNGAHFGKNSLDDTNYTFCADTFFSSLCIESIKMGNSKLDYLLECVKKGELLFSDAFPYIKNTYYIPKPKLRLNLNEDGNSSKKKKFKNLSYLDIKLLNEYLSGNYPEDRMKDLNNLGTKYIKTSVSIRGEEESKPYRVGEYKFYDKCGLYIIVAFKEDNIFAFLMQLMDSLSFTGIGGKRNSGLGKFFYYDSDVPDDMKEYFIINDKSDNKFMTLSVALPRDNEIDDVIEKAEYQLIKRSGFVYSDKYADEQLRKKDLYVFDSGSCFSKTFEGDVYDVSADGNHPVYRYAKPIFIKLDDIYNNRKRINNE